MTEGRGRRYWSERNGRAPMPGPLPFDRLRISRSECSTSSSRPSTSHKPSVTPAAMRSTDERWASLNDTQRHDYAQGPFLRWLFYVSLATVHLTVRGAARPSGERGRPVHAADVDGSDEK